MSVSVIIPALNAGSFITRAIESALAQGKPLHEIIVVDDGSTDNTSETVASLATQDRRIKLIRLPNNQGPGPARNAAIAAATGEWIGILDADDSYLPGRLDYLVTNAEKHRLDYAADNIMLFDYSANRISGIGISQELVGSILLIDRYTLVENSMTNRKGNIDFGLLQPIVRRGFIHEKNISYPSVRSGEDFAFYLRGMIAGGAFALFPEAYYLCTERSGSISGKASGISRTSVNYTEIAKFTLSLVNEPEIRKDQRLVGLLEKRARMLDNLAVRNELRIRWHRRQYAAFTRLLCTDRRAITNCASVAKNIILSYLSKTLS
jgi:succinoglycan biosynthesis protein ExoO